jgi:hypothetical protein
MSFNFRYTKHTEEFLENLCRSVCAENKGVMGRSGLFLALGRGIPEKFKVEGEASKDLNHDTVIKDELKDLVRAALNYRCRRTLDETSYRAEFRRYFEYGGQQLKILWEDCGRDQAKFVTELLRIGGDDVGLPANVRSFATTRSTVESVVELKLLADSEPWRMNDTTIKGQPNSLMIISGQPGSGKSQLALDLLAQLSRQGVRFLFFDLKGEMEEAGDDEQKAANRKKFFDLTGAQYVRLIDQSLPVNPLYAGENSADTANIASRVAALVRAFGPQMGPNQETAIRDAYQVLSKPDFAGLVNELEQNGEEGVAVSVLSKIVDLNIFASSDKAKTFEDWISRSNIIDLKKLDNETRVLVVAFILNFFIERLNKNLSVREGVQPIQMVLFVDEAHNVLPKDGKAQLLEKLAREGRSWGFPLWLASQDADKFVSSGVDFAELASAGIHFSPQTLKPKEQKDILGAAVSKHLEKGEAVLRLGGKTTIGGTRQFWRDGGAL